MICPKCRKNYPDGIDVCPECGTQLIALMGEADAPIDEDNDNISNIDVVFGAENIEGYSKFSEAVAESSQEPETEEADESYFDGEDAEPLADEEAYGFNENFSLSYSDDSGDYADGEDDDIIIYSHSTQDADDNDNDYDDTDTDIDDYSISQLQEHELFEEEYEVDFSDSEPDAGGEYVEDDGHLTDYRNDEFFREFENGAENKNSSEQEQISQKTYTSKGEYYKTFRQEQELRNKKNMNILTALIFTAAVVLVIASVVCFVLGSTTELTEINIENMLFDIFGQ